MRSLEAKVWPLFAEGKLNVNLERRFIAQNAEAAFAALESNEVNGKVVLVLDEGLE